MRPRWRWALFCLASWLHFRTDLEWPTRLLGWCVLPEWVWDGEEWEQEEDAAW